jgi:uncharacterized membrane protein YbjE (DUF340 family)
VAIDPFLYLAFAIGLAAGRLLPSRGPWPGRLTLGVVVFLIALLGATLAAAATDDLVRAVPLALALVGLILGFTAVLAWVLRRPSPTPPPGAGPPPSRWLGVVFLIALLGGFVAGHAGAGSPDRWIEPTLYGLLALVGFDLRWSTGALKRLWVPLVSAVGGALAAGAVATWALGLSVPVAFGTTFGFGFYSLAGPLLAARLGAAAGFIAFLTNFLRENLTMIASPYLGPRLRGEGLTALGGATSMDTTLYFVTHFGDPEAGSVALTSGLILTIGATLALPLLLSAPGA